MNTENKKLMRLSLFLSVFLCILIGIKYFYYFREKITITVDSLTPSQYSYIADSSLYHFSPHEGKWLSKMDVFQSDYLHYFPDTIGDWIGHPIDHSYADITLFREYQHIKTKETLWFILVSGQNESQFHSAEVCYLSDGWDVARREIKKVIFDKDQFPIRYMIAQKNNNIHLVSSWYIWKSPRRSLQEGAYLFRISVELSQNEEQGQKLLLNFLESLSNLKIVKKENPKIPFIAKNGEPRTLPPVVVSAQSKLFQAKQKALDWIIRNRVPNTVVPFPPMDRRYLILSYELNPDHPESQNDRSYNYIYSRASIYDNALAVIALTMAKKYSEAANIIDAFERIMRENGELWFSYNTHNEWPSESDHSEATIRNGASGWVGYAVAFFLRSRLLEDQNYRETRDFERYLTFAKNVTEAILRDQIQIKDISDPRFGLVTGGNGSFEFQWDKKRNKVIEKYADTKIQWASIEHNIDLYFLLKDLIYLSSHSEARSAEESLTKLKQAMSRAWNSKEHQFNRGMRKDGADTFMALDCASWGLMYLLSIGDKEKAKLTKNVLDRYKTKDLKYRVSGYKPYYKGYVFDELSINRLFYPHHPKKDWADVDMIWSEGSLGVAMAYLKLGDKEKAKQILDQMIKLQVPSGGLRYATHEIPFQFTPNPSLAGTAWFVMVESALEDSGLLELFWQ